MDRGGRCAPTQRRRGKTFKGHDARVRGNAAGVESIAAEFVVGAVGADFHRYRVVVVAVAVAIIICAIRKNG